VARPESSHKEQAADVLKAERPGRVSRAGVTARPEVGSDAGSRRFIEAGGVGDPAGLD